MTQLVAQQKLPLKQIYIDNIDHSAQVNLTTVFKKLEHHATLERLSLQFNELTPKTCESLVQILRCQNAQLKEILLSHCSLALSDLKKIQAAALSKGKKFSLMVDNVDTTKTAIQNHIIINYSSFLQVKILTFLKMPIWLSKSNGEATLSKNYKSILSSAPIAQTEEISSLLSVSKSQSVTDISCYKKNSMKLNFY